MKETVKTGLIVKKDKSYYLFVQIQHLIVIERKMNFCGMDCTTLKK
jgi:hypothetical protein